MLAGDIRRKLHPRPKPESVPPGSHPARSRVNTAPSSGILGRGRGQPARPTLAVSTCRPASTAFRPHQIAPMRFRPPGGCRLSTRPESRLRTRSTRRNGPLEPTGIRLASGPAAEPRGRGFWRGAYPVAMIPDGIKGFPASPAPEPPPRGSRTGVPGRGEPHPWVRTSGTCVRRETRSWHVAALAPKGSAASVRRQSHGGGPPKRFAPVAPSAEPRRRPRKGCGQTHACAWAFRLRRLPPARRACTLPASGGRLRSRSFARSEDRASEIRF